MDAETLKGLGWLLFWGALLHLMMRHGCGAHRMGGHGDKASGAARRDGGTFH